MPESHILFMRRRVQKSEIPTVMGELLGGALGHATNSGATLAGPPFCRYREVSAEGMTLEAGVALAGPAPGLGGVLAGTLPAGPVASTIHTGPYDALGGAYAALGQWMSDRGLKPAGDAWEVYLTDPGEVTDPAQWQTQINWPVSE